MPTDILIQLRDAERQAEARIADAQQQARSLDEKTEQEVAKLLVQAERDALAEAEALKRHRIAQALEEAHALRKQADAQANHLRDHLIQRVDEAAARIVAYILPNQAHVNSPEAQNK